MKRGKANSPKGIGGWLLVVLLGFIFSGITILILFVQKLTIILTNQVKFGIYISLFLIFLYLIFIANTILMILNKRKFAVKTFIATAIVGTIFQIWYYIVSQLIYNPNNYTTQIISNIPFVLINIAIVFLMATYLLKSKRVKNTLVK